jgi:hypothetical protein
LEGTELVGVLEGFLSHPSGKIRNTAWKLFETLLPRASADESTASGGAEEPTHVSRQLLGMVTAQLEGAAGAYEGFSTPSMALAPPPGAPSHVVVLDETLHLGRDMVGKVAPHVALGLASSFSFWMWRVNGAMDMGNGEWKMGEGARVRRGPDWDHESQDGGEGNLGTVVKVNGPGAVTVQWDGQDGKFTYNYSADGSSDVMLVDGGVLVSKGSPALLADDERGSWSALHVALTDAAMLEFGACMGGKEWFRVCGRRRVPPAVWVHVTVSISKEGVALYQGGEEDVRRPLDPALLQVGPVSKSAVEIESPHNYNPNMDEHWSVEVPNAEGYTVTFSDLSRTERNYDWVTLYSWDDNTVVYGESKYTGGMGGSERNFPGVDGVPPLVVNAPRFIVYFHSDGEGPCAAYTPSKSY